MPLELPGPAVVALNMVGLPWPGIDEDQLRGWANDLRAFSAQMIDASARSRAQVAALAAQEPSPPAKALRSRWEHYHGVISALRGPMGAFAAALNVSADAVVAQKGIVIGAAVALAGEIAATQGEALVTLGLAEAEVPAEVAAARLVVRGALQELEAVLLGRLVGAACSEMSAIKSGKATSRFSERDCEVFSRYMIARKRRYPVFIASKRTWEGVLGVLPPKASQAIKHHILPGAQQAIRRLNRAAGKTDRGPDR